MVASPLLCLDSLETKMEYGFGFLSPDEELLLLCELELHQSG